MSNKNARRCGRNLARLAVMAAVALQVVGCASAPPQEKLAPATVPPVPTVQQYLDQAAQAHTEGQRNKERDTYRAAAASHPTAKEPWLKLAEGHFEDGDYGNAILAAQEVLHRDSADTVATSLLAVSGLRVASTALLGLRDQKNLGADTRSQAEGVARTLREVLGEPVLVPKAEAAPVPPPKRTAAARPLPKPAVPGASALSTSPVVVPPPAAGNATTQPPKGVNPFAGLK